MIYCVLSWPNYLLRYLDSNQDYRIQSARGYQLPYTWRYQNGWLRRIELPSSEPHSNVLPLNYNHHYWRHGLNSLSRTGHDSCERGIPVPLTVILHTISGGDRTWTDIFRVMSPALSQLSYPALTQIRLKTWFWENSRNLVNLTWAIHIRSLTLSESLSHLDWTRSQRNGRLTPSYPDWICLRLNAENPCPSPSKCKSICTT